MKALFDFMPGYCPSCGGALNWQRHEYPEWSAGVEFTCKCGAQLQRLELLDTELQLVRDELEAVKKERDALVRWQTAKLNGEPLF